MHMGKDDDQFEIYAHGLMMRGKLDLEEEFWRCRIWNAQKEVVLIDLDHEELAFSMYLLYSPNGHVVAPRTTYEAVIQRWKMIPKHLRIVYVLRQF